MNLSGYLVATAIATGLVCLNPGVLQHAHDQTSGSISFPELKQQRDPFFNRVYLSKDDAEKILGEKAFLSDSSSAVKKDTLEIKNAYTAVSQDNSTDKTGVIYFMIEEYKADLSAKNAYSAIKKANENHEGVKTINDMGDEAYFHSDGQNFLFVLVRKGKRMFRIKVNKITSHTSLTAFNQVSKKISDGL